MFESGNCRKQIIPYCTVFLTTGFYLHVSVHTYHNIRLTTEVCLSIHTYHNIRLTTEVCLSVYTYHNIRLTTEVCLSISSYRIAGVFFAGPEFGIWGCQGIPLILAYIILANSYSIIKKT
jgi:hypothetical protein